MVNKHKLLGLTKIKLVDNAVRVEQVFEEPVYENDLGIGNRPDEPFALLQQGLHTAYQKATGLGFGVDGKTLKGVLLEIANHKSEEIENNRGVELYLVAAPLHPLYILF